MCTEVVKADKDCLLLTEQQELRDWRVHILTDPGSIIAPWIKLHCTPTEPKTSSMMLGAQTQSQLTDKAPKILTFNFKMLTIPFCRCRLTEICLMQI